MSDFQGIGGYFDIELAHRDHYHKNAIRLNTARNAFEYILSTKKYKKIYLPFYICDVMYEPLNRLGVPYEFYSIREDFSPQLPASIGENEAFLYVNYFGLYRQRVEEVARQLPNLIIDNSQAFFCDPIRESDTFYSARKFFGVPDGAYLYTDTRIESPLNTDISYNRFTHLLKRADMGPEDAYKDFQQAEASLSNQPILTMSKLTAKLLSSINYNEVRQIRRENFAFLHQHLASRNELCVTLDGEDVPMVYPFLAGKPGARENLIAKRIFIAQYWHNVLESAAPSSFETKLAKFLLPLPVDQRYNRHDMQTIITLLDQI